MNKFRVAIKNKDGSFRICEVCAIIYRVDGIRVEYTYAVGNTVFVGQVIIDGENAIIEQSTGLTDKNNKEIFEGDICDLGNNYRITIIFKDAGFGWLDFPNSKYARIISFSGHNYLSEVVSKIEVIGNIHDVLS